MGDEWVAFTSRAETAQGESKLGGCLDSLATRGRNTCSVCENGKMTTKLIKFCLGSRKRLGLMRKLPRVPVGTFCRESEGQRDLPGNQERQARFSGCAL